MVQVKDVDPDAFVASLAVTVTVYVPGALGVPEIWPALDIDTPGGRPDPV